MSESRSLSWLEPTIQAVADDSGDGYLIARCLSGDEMAYVALFDQYSGLVYRLAYSLLQHQEDAEEVLQDSFEYAFRRLDHFDERKASFKTWLYQIVVSRCRNKRRRKWLPFISIHEMGERDARDPNVLQPEEFAALNERQRIILKALNELSPKLQEVAILRYYGGLQYAEIGQILNIPPKTAESRMRLAHKALRDRLDTIIN